MVNEKWEKRNKRYELYIIILLWSVMIIIFSHLLYSNTIKRKDTSLLSISVGPSKLLKVYIRFNSHKVLLSKRFELHLSWANIYAKKLSKLIMIWWLWEIDFVNSKSLILLTQFSFFYLKKEQQSGFLKRWLTIFMATKCFLSWVIAFQWNL